ncbi:hypothetical protein ES705_31362 [subsurface metagenome]
MKKQFVFVLPIIIFLLSSTFSTLQVSADDELGIFAEEMTTNSMYVWYFTELEFSGLWDGYGIILNEETVKEGDTIGVKVLRGANETQVYRDNSSKINFETVGEPIFEYYFEDELLTDKSLDDLLHLFTVNVSSLILPIIAQNGTSQESWFQGPYDFFHENWEMVNKTEQDDDYYLLYENDMDFILDSSLFTITMNEHLVYKTYENGVLNATGDELIDLELKFNVTSGRFHSFRFTYDVEAEVEGDQQSGRVVIVIGGEYESSFLPFEWGYGIIGLVIAGFAVIVIRKRKRNK